MESDTVPKATSTKRTRPQGNTAADLMRYDPGVFPLIPLRKPFSIIWERDKKGKWVKVPAGKMPLHAKWTTRKYSSTKVRTICLERGNNVGVRLTEELLVLDVDPRNGGDKSFAAFCHDVGIDGDKFPRVLTGSGGWHCYMSKPADVYTVETLEDYPGLEFKTKGRQVVAAGSTHPNGMPYLWSPEYPDIEDGLPKAPKALLRAISYTPTTNGSEGGEWTPAQVAKALDRLDVTDFDSNEKWLPLMQACHHASGGGALAEFIAWSTSDPEYARDEEKIKKRWRSLRRSGGNVVTIRTLFKILRDNNASDLVPANVVHDDEFPED